VPKKETSSSAEPANQREEPRETAPGSGDNRALSSASAAESASVSVPTVNPAPGEPKPKPALPQSTQPGATLHRADSVEGAARGRSRRGSGSSEGMAEDASRAKDRGEPLAVFSMIGFQWGKNMVFRQWPACIGQSVLDSRAGFRCRNLGFLGSHGETQQRTCIA
jgi:hypothetical protein